MSWGWMSGLGSGLQQAGGMILDENKRKTAERLATERENRAEEREKAREARRELLERQKVTSTESNPDRGVKVLRNSFGDVIREEPMSSHEMAQIQRDTEKEQVSLRKLMADSALAESKAANYEQDAELDRAAVRARIRASDASAAASGRSNRGTSLAESVKNVGTGQKVNDLLAANKTLVDDLTRGTDTNPADFSVAELTELADAARRAAIDQNKDVNQTFQILMRREAAKRRAERDSTSNGR